MSVAVHGDWGQWQGWSSCSVPCGGGIQVRTRRCDNPAPKAGGAVCSGNSAVSRACNSEFCNGRKHLNNVSLSVCLSVCLSLSLSSARAPPPPHTLSLSLSEYCDRVDMFFIYVLLCGFPWCLAASTVVSQVQMPVVCRRTARSYGGVSGGDMVRNRTNRTTVLLS